MKLDLLESGLQNIRQLAKQYNKAIIYFHMDLDGVTSAIAMKEYLKHYGIQTIGVQKIQYGNMEYAISKPQSDDILPVLVDFAHGKVFMKIHTDHHDRQIAYDNASKNFRHSPSNAGTISAVISPRDIFSAEDVRIINMIDSAGFKKENVNVWDMIKAVLKTNKNETVWRNHLQMGMITGKLLLTFKNRPNFLETIVMNSNPSLESMYSVMIKMIKNNVENKEKGWVLPSEIEKNSQRYYDQQTDKKIHNGTVDEVESVKSGVALKIGNCVFQMGSGYVAKAGMYDRYTVFRLYPDVKYMVMVWDSLGMMQVSKNPWDDKQSDVNLGELVIGDIFKNKFEKYLKAPKYNISLLALKKYYESSITEENEKMAVGFDYNELLNLFNQNYDNLTDKQQYVIRKWMNWKPSDFNKQDYEIDDEGEEIIDPKIEKKNNEIDRAIKYLNSLTIPLPTIIDKTSGGHPSITNLSGFGFIEVQKDIDRAIKNGENPMTNKKKQMITKYEPTSDKSMVTKYEPTSVKIMKSISRDVIKQLNKKEV